MNLSGLHQEFFTFVVILIIFFSLGFMVGWMAMYLVARKKIKQAHSTALGDAVQAFRDLSLLRTPPRADQRSAKDDPYNPRRD